ncbi:MULTISPECIES: methyl-accepting chemotaxis protein [unclassified Roseateles]|uniref:methyl-accepting chemotaxis protein n=1 Tax=unclassified Roseateles TaxID=2626991 RepID=UPI0006F4675D|nr:MULTISPECIES: methyl-accepting chemotaxis protein [unclassified Roseateles]KQW50824.1 chemotaxis protein [Pelomonas sp. Root405]KRA70816.1 chemotaxis protein [Pelomonas sp. Root662]
MNAIANLKIGVRLTIGFAAVISLLIMLAAIGVTKISAISADTEIILHDRFAKVELAQTVENEVNKQLRALSTALIATDAALAEKELAKLEASLPVVANAIDKLTASVREGPGLAALKEVVESGARFKAKEQQLIASIKGGRAEEARALLISDVLPLQSAYLMAIESFAKSQADSMEEFGTDAAELGSGAKLLMEVLSLIAVLLAIVIAFLLKRSITLPIADALRIAETVAAGDLTSRFTVNSRDETGQLLTALGSMNESLVRIVHQVRLSSDSIATGSHQIASGGVDLSQRTEEQASSLQETASAMEEVTTTVQRSAESARNARTLAASASAVATKGGAVVAEVVATMKDISASSHRIADITGVIDGIAFQTNILALNAAVEAARAGEQGRGFAVVAGEVRTLAQRAATAAREIKVLIAESVGRVETGSRLVAGAGMTMDELVQQVQQVAALIAEISTATEQQSLGLGEVSKAVNQLDQVTQQNAALVEESAAAAGSLSHQAKRLTELVGAFKLNDQP